jgi:hypothetical protein
MIDKKTLVLKHSRLGHDIRRRIKVHGLYAAARWAYHRNIDIRFFINAMNTRV